jgi:hypothetical protein
MVVFRLPPKNELIILIKVKTRKKTQPTNQLGFAGGAQPDCLKQLTFFPHLMLIIVGQSRNMLKLIHQQIGFSHFNTLLLLFHKEILYLHVHKYLLN